MTHWEDLQVGLRVPFVPYDYNTLLAYKPSWYPYYCLGYRYGIFLLIDSKNDELIQTYTNNMGTPEEDFLVVPWNKSLTVILLTSLDWFVQTRLIEDDLENSEFYLYFWDFTSNPFT